MCRVPSGPLEFFDNLGMNKTVLGAFDAYWKFITDMIISQIELTTNFAKIYVQFRLSALDSYDKVVHLMMWIATQKLGPSLTPTIRNSSSHKLGWKYDSRIKIDSTESILKTIPKK